MVSAILVALFTTLAIASAHSYGIVGGIPANITELPHQVFVRVKAPGQSRCGGGSIISRFHILTVAHCVEELNIDNIEIILGTDNTTSGEGKVYKLAEITIHENYAVIFNTSIQILNDIAVLKLDKKIKLSDKAKIISLAKPKYEVTDGTELIVSGFGSTMMGDPTSSHILRKITVQRVSFDKCRQAWADNAEKTGNITVNENQICAEAEGEKCIPQNGDGTALIEKTKHGNVQVGIASFTGCDGFISRASCPDVYTEVSKYYKWIKNIVKQDLEAENELTDLLGGDI